MIFECFLYSHLSSIFILWFLRNTWFLYIFLGLTAVRKPLQSLAIQEDWTTFWEEDVRSIQADAVPGFKFFFFRAHLFSEFVCLPHSSTSPLPYFSVQFISWNRFLRADKFLLVTFYFYCMFFLILIKFINTLTFSLLFLDFH